MAVGCGREAGVFRVRLVGNFNKSNYMGYLLVRNSRWCAR
jgi:hypothetical protein